MRRCEDCQLILDSNVRFCPKCGKQVGPTGARGAQRDVNALLASANLHRIRQEWDAAIADATDALRVTQRTPMSRRFSRISTNSAGNSTTR